MKNLKRTRVLAFLMTMIMAVSLAACGTQTASENTESDTTESATGEESTGTDAGTEKVVNIGMTDSLSSVNPLLMDATEILKYSLGMEFLPLVELNQDLEFEGMLASDITTTDNTHFTVTIDPEATWSDGVPVTADDVVFTVLKLASPVLANVNLALYAFEGIGDDGFVEEGATEISGVVAVDDKTVEFTTKYPMALTTFENTYGRYILTIPKHILENVADADLASYEWFSAPTVVDGPYSITDYDLQHYVSYVANSTYWKGAPNIDKLNITIVASSQLLSGLQSGEIDFVQQTTGNILQEDYESVEALDNVTVTEGAAVTNQSIFFNTDSVTDSRIRQAILYGIDRETLVSGFLNGMGEVVDGFLSSASPFYSSELVPVSYDPDKAAALVQEAVADGWDADRVLKFNVNSGDATFVQAADYIAAKLEEVGIHVQINTVDLATLLTDAGNKDYDLMAVQYTYAPVDPYPDINWLLSEDGWTGYYDESISEALGNTQLTSDITEIQGLYLGIDQKVVEDVPMMSAYVISALGAVNNRLVNAVPDVYGSFINVNEWDVVE